jgi:hypothetical protein
MILSTKEIGGHVDTKGQGTGRRRRRNHSEQFKAEAVAACRQPGASIAATAAGAIGATGPDSACSASTTQRLSRFALIERDIAAATARRSAVFALRTQAR